MSSTRYAMWEYLSEKGVGTYRHVLPGKFISVTGAPIVQYTPVQPRMDWPDQPIRHDTQRNSNAGYLSANVYGQRFRIDFCGRTADEYVQNCVKTMSRLEDKITDHFGSVWRRDIGKNYARPTHPLSHRLLPYIHNCVQGELWMVVRGVKFSRIILVSMMDCSTADAYTFQITKNAEEIFRDADGMFGREWVFEVGLGLMSKEGCIKRQLA